MEEVKFTDTERSTTSTEHSTLATKPSKTGTERSTTETTQSITDTKLSTTDTKLSTTDTKLSTTTITQSPTIPDSINQQVRIITKAEHKAAALSLAHAFKDDDVALYFVDTGNTSKRWTAEKRWALHLHILECLVLAHIMRGIVTTIGPNYDSVALWMPPGKDFDGICAQLRSGLLLMRFRLTKEGRVRFYQEFMPLLHEKKHEVLGADDSRAWYLVYLGTRPESRGKGYAKALVEYTTKQADAHSRPCYLESSNVLNTKLYNRLGFEAVGAKAVLKRGPRPVEMELMVRKAMEGEGEGEGKKHDSEAGVVREGGKTFMR